MNGIKSDQKKTKEFRKQNLRSTVKHSGGVVMVWGSTVHSGICNIEFMHGIVDQNKYIDI